MIELTFDQLIDYAIKSEEEAENFYRQAADKVEKPHSKKMLLELAEQEKTHKEKLLKLKLGKIDISQQEKSTNLHIAEYLPELKFSPDMEPQEILIMAMKREQKAYEFYSRLAESLDEGNLKKIVKFLANEELKHKSIFEKEYDDIILEGT